MSRLLHTLSATVILCFLAVHAIHAELKPPSPATTVAVTTTLLETAVHDLLGEAVSVFRLMAPGSCPGHFDLDPHQVKTVASAAVFLRHDFQNGLDAGLIKAGLAVDRIMAVPSQPAFTIPSAYAAFCGDVADALMRVSPTWAESLSNQLAQIHQKAFAEEQQAQARLVELRGRPILCAAYQSVFCRWAGLDVVAVFHAGTDESARQLHRALDMASTAHAEAVIGNAQWGPRHLQALSEASGQPGIMLSNFPDSGAAGAMWDLLDANVRALMEGFRCR